MEHNNATHQMVLRVRAHLDAGQIAEAVDLLLKVSPRPLELQSALGVCWLRQGEYDKALMHFRTMVLVDGGVCYREDVSPVAITNFATALLLSGNVAGCEAALKEVVGRNDMGVARLREAIRKWKQSQSLLERIKIAVIGLPYEADVKLDFAPGDF